MWGAHRKNNMNCNGTLKKLFMFTIDATKHKQVHFSLVCFETAIIILSEKVSKYS